MIPCRKIGSLINNNLNYRHELSNGLAQGSVLAPLLYSLYISDLQLLENFFDYANAWTLEVQQNLMEITQELLKADLIIIGQKIWRLTQNLDKTEVSCFHLNNKLAKASMKNC